MTVAINEPRAALLATLNVLAENPTGDTERLIAFQGEVDALWAKVEAFTDKMVEEAMEAGEAVDPTARAMVKELTDLHSRIDMAMDAAVRACHGVR